MNSYLLEATLNEFAVGVKRDVNTDWVSEWERVHTTLLEVMDE